MSTCWWMKLKHYQLIMIIFSVNQWELMQQRLFNNKHDRKTKCHYRLFYFISTTMLQLSTKLFTFSNSCSWLVVAIVMMGYVLLALLLQSLVPRTLDL